MYYINKFLEVTSFETMTVTEELKLKSVGNWFEDKEEAVWLAVLLRDAFLSYK